MKPTHKELAARAMLLGEGWFYDWRDGTFTCIDFNDDTTRMFNPHTLQQEDAAEMTMRLTGRAVGWKASSMYGTEEYKWETPVARMDDDDANN